MRVRLLDLDGGVARQSRLCRLADQFYNLRSQGPLLRMACGHRAFAELEVRLARLSGRTRDDEPTITFVGSGDFHHLSLALVRRLPRRCNLLILDNHPDWVRGVPMLHCGTWVWHAARLPQVERVFHVGGETDFDNSYRHLAPARMLRSGKITVIPAARKFHGSPWDEVPHEPLRESPDVPADARRIAELVRPHLRDLGRLPLYVSFDRDVLVAEDAAVNWDSGRLTRPEVLAVMEAFFAASARLAGMDVVGDWSEVEVSGPLRNLLHWTEHPPMKMSPEEARDRNEGLNLEVLRLVESHGKSLSRAS